jgi:response regulator RpfG family c-di-GMP phosphodiesterase
MSELHPDTVRILLTGQADVPAAIAAVNEGKIFRFLTKPCAPDLLNSVLFAAAEQHRLITAERVLLQQTLRGSIQALADVVGLVHPAVVGRASRIKRLMADLATKLGIRDQWMIEISALLAHLGYITLPAATVEKLHAGSELGLDEQALVDHVPEVAARLIAGIPRLEEIREILLHQNTRYDGTGSPAPPRRGDALPAGARLLKLATDFDVLEAQGLTAAAAVEQLAGRGGWYDPVLLAALRERCGSPAAANEIQVIPLADVRVGMVFAGDVKSPSGLLLIARGQEVTESLFGRIRNYWQGFARSVKVSVIAAGGGADHAHGEAPAEFRKAA